MSVRSVLVIGGVTAETSDTKAELPRLHKASFKLGRLLADAGADLPHKLDTFLRRYAKLISEFGTERAEEEASFDAAS